MRHFSSPVFQKYSNFWDIVFPSANGVLALIRGRKLPDDRYGGGDVLSNS